MDGEYETRTKSVGEIMKIKIWQHPFSQKTILMMAALNTARDSELAILSKSQIVLFGEYM